MQSFTPFLKLACLDSDTPGGWLASALGSGAQEPLPAAASSCAAMKGAGSAANPLMLPNTFIPMPTATGLRPQGGKLQPGGTAPLLLAQQGSGGFSIPAYGRPFSQLDFIPTGEHTRRPPACRRMHCSGYDVPPAPGQTLPPPSVADLCALLVVHSVSSNIG